MKRTLFLTLTLIVSFLLSLGVSIIIKAQIFNIHEFGFQFIMFSIAGSFIYFTLKYMRMLNTLTVVIFLALIFTFLYKSTTMMQVLGNISLLFLYLFLLFFSLAFVLKIISFNDNFTMMKNLSFSILASLTYTAVHIIINLIIGTKISGNLFFSYFKNGFVIMITIGVAFTISEVLFTKFELLTDKTPFQNEEDDDNEEV